MLPCRQSAVAHLDENRGPPAESERFARFGCDLDSRTQNSIARATGKVASEKKQRLERQASVRLKRSAATLQGQGGKQLPVGPALMLDLKP